MLKIDTVVWVRRTDGFFWPATLIKKNLNTKSFTVAFRSGELYTGPLNVDYIQPSRNILLEGQKYLNEIKTKRPDLLKEFETEYFFYINPCVPKKN